MKELAKQKVKQLLKQNDNLFTSDIDDKIDYIYDLGYIYNPYKKVFYNPFINKKIKDVVVANFSLEKIDKLHNFAKEDYLRKNKEIKNIDSIKKSIYKNNKISKFSIFFDTYSGVLGIFFLLGAIFFHLANNFSIASIILSISFILINFYLVFNHLFVENEGEWKANPFWLKYQSIFFILYLLIFPYLYYLLYKITNSIWIPIIIIYTLRYLVVKYTTNKLSREYIQMTGINDILSYADNNKV